jgi:hypothetical protein
MRSYIVFLSALFALILFAGPSFAEIRVVSVKGTAAYKTGNQWTPLQTGTALAVGTKVSTGVRSTVEIRINNHLVTVQPLTIMKISQSSDTATTSNTNLGLRRGSVRTKVAKDARIKTVFKVSTPVATSSVRGTEQIVVYSPTFGMRVFVLSGTVEGSGMNGGSNLIFGNLQFWQKMGKGAPESVMSGMDDFIAKTHSLFVSLDEEKALQLFGDDFLFYDPGTTGNTDQLQKVPVSIYLIWPN